MFENLSTQDKLLSCKFLLHLPALSAIHRQGLSSLLDDVGLLNERNVPLNENNDHILDQVNNKLESTGWVEYSDWQTDLLDNVDGLW